MCKFIYKQTNDGIYHLYLDDPSKKDFIKIGEAKSIMFLKEDNRKFVLLFNEDGVSKTLFGIIDNKVFQVNLSQNAKASIVNNVCVYEKESLWYTMQLDENGLKEILLGIKHRLFLNAPECTKYRTPCWIFFTKNINTYKEIYNIVDRKCICLGKYSSIENDDRAKIFALKQDGFYDVFTPFSTKPEQGRINEVFNSLALNRVFLWDDDHKHWKSYPGSLLGKNAVCNIEAYDGKNKISLYQIENGSLKLVIENYDYKFVTPSSVVIDGLRFSVDPKTRLIDFDGPMEILKKRIKKTLK